MARVRGGTQNEDWPYPSSSCRPPDVSPPAWQAATPRERKANVKRFLDENPLAKWRPSIAEYLPEGWSEPAGPAKINPARRRRSIVEFCCHPDLELGQSQYVVDDCAVVRCSMDHDVTTERASISCTGGSQTWTKNIKNPGGPERRKQLRAEFESIWRNFAKVARECRES